MTLPRVLLIDDDVAMRQSTEQALDLAGFTVTAFSTAEEALTHAGPGFNGVVVSDIRMPGMDGMTLLQRLGEIDRDLPVILITGHADVELAVEAMRRGAYDFIAKPFAIPSLATVLRRAADHRALVMDNRRLRAAAGQQDDLEVRLPGRSAPMIDLRRRLRTIGASEADVLVTGPTGAGKEVVARALHDLSARAARPFVVVNCAALSATLIESELFGHEAGAFAGALRARYGRFEHARGGTVLLDDIDTMPLDLQAKLLRVLQDRVITRLGSNDPIALDVRFIATSRVALPAQVARGAFREDLYFRLAVTTLAVPPLTARREDISLLFLHLLREAAARHGAEDRSPAPEVLADLTARDWPGNVRELRNLADRHVLGLDWMPGADGAPLPRLATRVAEFERSVIAAAIAAHGGRLRGVYEDLGISRKTLYEKMQKHGLDRRLITDGDATED
ncbi:two-component system, NtrC family, C4-dicarboxylate transport response regulator DctD [Loktanella fryxellensis]|uniref:Nif-specific regulatory protein n=1 Tax=Loktanella fryxellensis TaxID=245187 RepID=A0A1H8F104_9RHOB|nr:sigma-54 dependent transcriptional regulator [Loktanella fryxellensis]SEN25326.1 two-component system, NtrC family, C4-dicarboxylate transport response regulator DctD [Loktanella fryxellensis]